MFGVSSKSGYRISAPALLEPVNDGDAQLSLEPLNVGGAQSSSAQLDSLSRHRGEREAVEEDCCPRDSPLEDRPDYSAASSSAPPTPAYQPLQRARIRSVKEHHATLLRLLKARKAATLEADDSPAEQETPRDDNQVQETPRDDNQVQETPRDDNQVQETPRDDNQVQETPRDAGDRVQVETLRDDPASSTTD